MATKILLRLDLNVPMRGSRIADDYKLRLSLPTIKDLLKKKAALIIVTHLGEPKPGQKISVKPLADWLSKKLHQRIPILKNVKKNYLLKSGDIIMLENIREFKGEITNDKTFAKKFASLADIYINDAFAVSHRNHVSVSAVTNFLPSFAGPRLKQEIIHLDRVKHGRKPFILIMGGAKVSTKLPLLKKLSKKANFILVGGDFLNNINKIKIKNVIKPVDVIKSKGKIVDIGPKTVKLYSQYIKKAKTIMWNGAMGIFEKGFSKGTKAMGADLAKAAKRGAYVVVGGGETAESASGQIQNFSWVSTGGGAALAYLAGEKLPGLKNILKK